MSAPRPAAMADVARVAGVSHQTVSRVVNNHPSVRPATRERVLAAMADLDYRPNRLAKALVTARSGLLGVITSGSARFGPTSTLMSVEEAARGAGFAVNVTSVRATDAEDVEGQVATAMAHALSSFDSQAVEAVVAIAPRVSVVEALAGISSRAPLLLVAAGVAPSERFGVVSVDQAGGARAVTAHLADLGHRRIAHLAGPSDWFDARERERGMREELSSRGLAAGPIWEGDWTAARGYAVGRALAEGPREELPTAMVVGNDQMALGLLRALWEAGISVPGDISITGFDDIEGADHFSPPLTTVRQNFSALGARVMTEVGLVLGDSAGGTAGVDGEETLAPSGTVVAPRLMVRASSGPPRA